MGRRLSDAEETQNIRELSDFRGYWRRSPEYPQDNHYNNRVHYPVNVTYIWKDGKKETEFTSTLVVFVGSGPDDGNVDIEETANVDIDKFHLSFKPAFQKYAYDPSDHSLVVTDSSQKMGGEYEVRIRPNIEEP